MLYETSHPTPPADASNTGGLQRLAELAPRFIVPLRSIAVLLVAAAAVAYGVRHVWRFAIDDAGISYAYARHLIEGEGLVAVVGGPTIEGYSNPLWVLVLAPFAATGESLATIAKWLGVFFYGGALLAGMRAVGLVNGRRWYELDWADLVIPLALSFSMIFIAWVPAGLENALYAAGLLALALLDIAESRDPHRRSWSALAAVAVALTRPEGVMYGLLFAGIKVLHALRTREHLRQTVTYLLLFVGPLAVYHLVHYLVFADLVPNTFHAKRPSNDRFDDALKYVEKFGPVSGFQYLLPLAAIGVVGSVRQKVGLVSIVLGAAVFLFYSGGDWMPHGRFVSFALAPLAVLAAFGMENLARSVSSLARNRIPKSGVAFAGTAVFAVPWWQFHDPELQRVERTRASCHLCHRVDDMKALEELRSGLDLPSATLLTHDFGGPAWLSSKVLYPIDLLGLCDHTLPLFQQYRRSDRYDDAYNLRFRYAFHEQGEFPTFIYFPPNFWPGFTDSAEYELGYYPLSRRRLGKRHRSDVHFAVHRGKYIDYFPPVETFQFEPIGAGLVLLGSSIQSREGPKGLSTVTLALLPGADWKAAHMQLRLTARAGNEKTSSQRVLLFPKDVHAGKRWARGEPRRIDFEMALPKAPLEELSLQIVQGRAAPQHVSLALPASRAMVPPPATLARFPDALKPPRDARLQELRARARRQVTERFARGDQTLRDEALASELEALAGELEARGDVEQAYVALVWATRVDRQALTRLHRRIEALRKLEPARWFASQLALLRQAYGSADDLWLARVAAAYAEQGAPDEARFFLERVRDREAFAAELRALDDALKGGKAEWPRRLRPRDVDGVEGPLAAAAPRRKGRSSRAASKPFVLDGRSLSFSIEGGGGRTKVELVVEGQALRTAAGSGRSSVRPVMWDTSELRGKTASIRATGASKGGANAIVLRDVRLWD